MCFTFGYLLELQSHWDNEKEDEEKEDEKKWWREKRKEIKPKWSMDNSMETR